MAGGAAVTTLRAWRAITAGTLISRGCILLDSHHLTGLRATADRIAGQRDNRDGRIEPLQRERIQSCVLGAAGTDLTAGASAVLEPTRYLVDGSRR